MRYFYPTISVAIVVTGTDGDLSYIVSFTGQQTLPILSFCIATMWRLLVLALLAAQAQAKATGSFIVGGQEVRPPGKYPWQGETGKVGKQLPPMF
jgi:hypothetical protein